VKRRVRRRAERNRLDARRPTLLPFSASGGHLGKTNAPRRATGDSSAASGPRQAHRSERPLASTSPSAVSPKGADARSANGQPTRNPWRNQTMTQSNRPTIRDVAAAAGVSAQTVSRVVNNHPDVAPETQERVEGVIRDIGYLPNVAARALAQGRRNRTATSGKALPARDPVWASVANAESDESID
jgi:transcriptional regulator with XRE-family HTH domain